MKSFGLVAVLLVVAGATAPGTAAAASVTGRISAGDALKNPEPLAVAMDAWLCGKDGKISDPRLSISAERGLANVVVKLKGEATAPPYPSSTEPAVMDQKKCVFEPHVVVVAPGQPVVSKNSDATLHNFHTKAEANKVINRAQTKGKDVTTKFAEPEIVRVECDIHFWMSAIVVVADSAWTAVTDAEGNFQIADVPDGSYQVELWHEQLGTRQGKVDVTAEGGSFELTWDVDEVEASKAVEPAPHHACGCRASENAS